MNEPWSTSFEARMNKYIHLLPLHVHRAMLDYVLERRCPGDFLEAVLSNKLKEAVLFADKTNRGAIVEIVSFCMNALPSECWGSDEKVNAWIDNKDETY